VLPFGAEFEFDHGEPAKQFRAIGDELLFSSSESFHGVLHHWRAGVTWLKLIPLTATKIIVEGSRRVRRVFTGDSHKEFQTR
jgi:hypothetical protein